MRDPKRIPKLLGLMQRIWEHSPDVRFHQMIENLKIEFQRNGGSVIVKKTQFIDSEGQVIPMTYYDAFYTEDDAFIDFLENYCKKFNIK